MAENRMSTDECTVAAFFKEYLKFGKYRITGILTGSGNSLIYPSKYLITRILLPQ